MNSPEQSRASGMTLVELLLAVTMLSAILAAAGGLVLSVARSHALSARAAGPAEQLEQALNYIEHDIESAQPFFGIQAQGSAAQYEFAREDRGTWLRVRLRFGPDEAGNTALIREAFSWGALDGPPVQAETLARVAQGTFAYAKQDTNGQLVWDSVWDGENDGVPRLVRVDPGIVLRSGQEPAVFSRVMRYPAGALPVLEPSP